MSNGVPGNGAHNVEQLDAPPPVSPELRAKILADPNVAKIAAELEMSVEEFVNTVGYYMNNPGVEPSFLVVSDENLEAFKAGQAPSGFDEARSKPVELNSQDGQAVTTKDAELDDAVKKGRTTVKP
jgi:hypothetical protein